MAETAPDCLLGDTVEQPVLPPNLLTYFIDEPRLLLPLKELQIHHPSSHQHGITVAEACVGVSQILDLCPDQEQTFVRAGSLHDVGKIGVSNETLDKPGVLSEVEWKEVRRHPAAALRTATFTGEMISIAAVDPSLAALILNHHRNYGDERKEEFSLGSAEQRELPLPTLEEGSKLAIQTVALRMADTFGAMIEERPYVPELPDRAAVEVALGGVIEAGVSQGLLGEEGTARLQEVRSFLLSRFDEEKG